MMDRLLFWLGLLLCLGVPTALVIQKERQLRGRQVIYLRLAPGPPAEVLAFDLALRPLDPSWPQRGVLRPSLDSRRVVNAWTADASAPPGERIRYSVQNSRVNVGTFARNTYSEEARYAKFDLTLEGELRPRGLADSTLHPL